MDERDKHITNLAALIGALYHFQHRVEAAGGCTSLSGIAIANTMMKSMARNRGRVDLIVSAALLSRKETA